MSRKWSDYFTYDETSSSCLRWKVSRWSGNGMGIEHIKSGQEAGCMDSKFQYQVNLDGVNTQAHRIIWELLVEPIPPKFVIDHINGNGSDNKVSNLRCIRNQFNARNAKKNALNTSGVCGVSLLTNKTCNGPNSYWTAAWASLDGSRNNKRFPISKYGNDEAFRLACDYRARMITELNLQGAGYTETHGIRNSHQ